MGIGGPSVTRTTPAAPERPCDGVGGEGLLGVRRVGNRSQPARAMLGWGPHTTVPYTPSLHP